MAKKNVENIEVEVEQKAPSFFKKLLYIVVIPLMFTIAIFLIVTTFTDTNVFKMAEKIPFLAKEDEIIENSALNEDKIVQLQAEIQEREAEITQLQTQIETAATEKDALVTEQERLVFEIEKLQRDQQETQKDFSEILSTFEKMSAKTAAPILVQMSDTESLRILSNMKPDTLSAIFTKMSPADAARYTELLAQQ